MLPFGGPHDNVSVITWTDVPYYYDDGTRFGLEREPDTVVRPGPYYTIPWAGCQALFSGRGPNAQHSEELVISLSKANHLVISLTPTY